VFKDGTPAAHGLEAELKDSVKGKLAPDKYPRWIEFVAELPRRPRARSTAS
jgi:benzoate-CoA ligase